MHNRLEAILYLQKSDKAVSKLGTQIKVHLPTLLATLSIIFPASTKNRFSGK